MALPVPAPLHNTDASGPTKGAIVGSRKNAKLKFNKDAVSHVPILIINLEHRHDLWERIQTQFQYLPFPLPVQRFQDSVDGEKSPERLDSQLFGVYAGFDQKKTANYLSRSELGCWLSHIRIWERRQSCLVVENRATLGPVFGRDWPRLAQYLTPCEDLIDLVWIGYHVENSVRAEMILDLDASASVPVPVSAHPIRVQRAPEWGRRRDLSLPVASQGRGRRMRRVPLPIAIGGTFGYYITARGCGKLLEALSKTGHHPGTHVTHPIDSWMMNHIPKHVVAFACRRPLIWSSYRTTSGDIRIHRRDNF